MSNVATPKRKKLGEILVERGLVTTFTVDRILSLSIKRGERFGTVLEEIGLVTGEELAQALAIQYGYKTVSAFAGHEFSPELLQLVPLETAVEHSVFPLKVWNDTLALAMIDPTNTKVITNLSRNGNMRIYPIVATRKDVNAAIARHYLKREVEQAEDTILVVEDDKLIVAMVSSILRSAGYRVVSALDGMEAFKEIISIKPQLIITDKEMPKFNGYALLESLKHIPETRAIPVILMSGSASPEEEANAYEKGFFDYVAKPIKEVTLKAKVMRALRTHEQVLVSRL